MDTYHHWHHADQFIGQGRQGYVFKRGDIVEKVIPLFPLGFAQSQVFTQPKIVNCHYVGQGKLGVGGHLLELSRQAQTGLELACYERRVLETIRNVGHTPNPGNQYFMLTPIEGTDTKDGRISREATLSYVLPMTYCQGLPIHKVSLVEKYHGLAGLCDVIEDLHNPAKLWGRATAVIHRDLKPEHVLVHDNTTSVIDFGVAKIMNQAQHHVSPITFPQAEFFGNMLYASPEQLARREAEHSDDYGVGLIALDVLTQTPFSSYRNRGHLSKDVLGTVPDRLVEAGVARQAATSLHKALNLAIDPFPEKRSLAPLKRQLLQLVPNNPYNIRRVA